MKNDIIYTKNKKALYDYTIIETLEAGVVLTGSQVKAIRASNIQMKGSYIIIKNNELFLTGCHISVPSGIPKYDVFNEKMDLKLLLHKKQILKLKAKVEKSSLTLIGLEMYQSKTCSKIKVKIALARGNTNYDKRHILKEKDINLKEAREF